MAVKREILIKARNLSLKSAGVPLRVVVATKTNAQMGMIAWVEDKSRDPYFHDVGRNQKSYNPKERFVVRVIVREDGVFKTLVRQTNSFSTLPAAKTYMAYLM